MRISGETFWDTRKGVVRSGGLWTKVERCWSYRSEDQLTAEAVL